MPHNGIFYSDRYSDDTFEYRYIYKYILGTDITRVVNCQATSDSCAANSPTDISVIRT